MRIVCWRFINRFLLKGKHATVPPDAAKLRISRTALKHIFSTLDTPSTFIYALSRYFLPSGRGLSSVKLGGDAPGSYLWHILPIRMRVKCTESSRCHIRSHSNLDQMNPFHHLHLPDQGVDIRGSVIALGFRYTKGGSSTSMVAVNFIDGRWPKTVQEPESRIKEVLEGNGNVCLQSNPFFIQLVYLTSVARWWTNSLSSIHDQLIAYVRKRPYVALTFCS